MPAGEIVKAGADAVGEKLTVTAEQIGNVAEAAQEVALTKAPDLAEGSAAGAVAVRDMTVPLKPSPGKLRALDAGPVSGDTVVVNGGPDFGNGAGAEGTPGPHGPNGNDQEFIIQDFTEADAARMTRDYERKNPGKTIVNGRVVSTDGAPGVASSDSKAVGGGNFNSGETYSAPIGQVSGARLNEIEAAVREEFGSEAGVDFSGKGDVGGGADGAGQAGLNAGNGEEAGVAASTATVETGPNSEADEASTNEHNGSTNLAEEPIAGTSANEALDGAFLGTTAYVAPAEAGTNGQAANGDAETARLTEYYKQEAEKFQAEQDAELASTYGRPEDVQADLRRAQQEAVQASLDAMNSLNQAYESGHPDAIKEARAAGAEADRQFAEAMHNFDPENRVVDQYGTPIVRDAAPVGELVDGAPLDAWQRDLVAEPADAAPDENTPGDGAAAVKIKAAPAEAQARARTHPADVRENENVTAGWKPARDGEGLVGPTGERIAVASGDGTAPVVLGDRVYYDNGDPWTGQGRQAQREAAAAAVDAVNFTAGVGTNGVLLNSENTAVVGQVMVADAGTPQAEIAANVPEYRQALTQMHGDQVGPTVFENVTLNPDGSLNSAVMHTAHRQPDGTVRTIESAFEDGRIYTPIDTNYPQNSDAPSLGDLTRDNVYSDGQHGIVIDAVGSSMVAPVVTDYPFTGGVTRTQARDLRRYEQAEAAVPPSRIRIVDFVPDEPKGPSDNGKQKARPDSDQGRPKDTGADGQSGPQAGSTDAATGGKARKDAKPRAADEPRARGDAGATARTEDTGSGKAGPQTQNGDPRGSERARAADDSQAEGGDAKTDASGKTREKDGSQTKSEPKAEEKKDTRTYYEILGIKGKPRKVTKTEIKRAYRARARQTHTDKGENGEEFRKVNEAYETLIDPAKKRTYDLQEAVRRAYEKVTFRNRASANGTPDASDGMRYPVGELGWDKAASPNAHAFANLFDFVRGADGGNQLVVDPGLFGFSNELYRCVLRALPHGAQKSDVISFRIYHIDSATQKPVGASESLRMTRASDGNVTVHTSEDFAALVDDDRLNGTGKRSADPEKVRAAVETISQALVLDPLDVATVEANTIFQSAQATADVAGSSGGGDLSNPSPDKDPDKGDKGTSGKRKAPDKKEDVDPLQKPLWELNDAERRLVLQQVVDDRLRALKRERRVKRTGNLKVRSNETLKDASKRRRKEDEQWEESKQRELELEGLREILDELEYARYRQNQEPSTPLKVQRQQRKAVHHVRRELHDKLERIMQIDWARAKGEPVKGIDVAHTFKEPRVRITAKQKGKAGNAHKKYSKSELREARPFKERHVKRHRKNGSEIMRKPNGKRRLFTKDELKDLVYVYTHRHYPKGKITLKTALRIIGRSLLNEIGR